MKISRLVLTLIAIFSAAIYINGEFNGTVLYIFKPLTMLSIMAIAVLNTYRQPGFYGKIIIVGLLFSLVGDIFLMFQADFFIAGLISFLIAHIFYIVAFAQGRALRASIKLLVPFLIYGILIFWLLVPFLGRLLWPVLAYIAVILVMGWQACARWTQLREKAAAFAFVGAIFFIVSDSVLAYNKFRGHIEFGRVLNLSAYFFAQWLIAWSIPPQLKPEKQQG